MVEKKLMSQKVYTPSVIRIFQGTQLIGNILKKDPELGHSYCALSLVEINTLLNLNNSRCVESFKAIKYLVFTFQM